MDIHSVVCAPVGATCSHGNVVIVLHNDSPLTGGVNSTWVPGVCITGFGGHNFGYLVHSHSDESGDAKSEVNAEHCPLSTLYS